MLHRRSRGWNTFGSSSTLAAEQMAGTVMGSQPQQRLLRQQMGGTTAMLRSMTTIDSTLYVYCKHFDSHNIGAAARVGCACSWPLDDAPCAQLAKLNPGQNPPGTITG